MQILRTSEADAAQILGSIADYPSGSRLLTIPAANEADDGQDLRVHLVDAGDPNAPVVVFLHGNPSWSYIWRYQIAAAVAAEHRARGAPFARTGRQRAVSTFVGGLAWRFLVRAERPPDRRGQK